MAEVLIHIDHLEKSFISRNNWSDTWSVRRVGFVKKERIYALNDISLTIYRGESLCIVGETGCGKSTLARVVMGLETPTNGQVCYQGQRIDRLSDKQRMPYRKKMQMVFQNPNASLNPRMTVYQMLNEAVSIHHPYFNRHESDEYIDHLLESVGLSQDAEDRFPHEFSGGQRQRISLARALSVEPEFIVADEPLSALDVSVQAQVLNLMMDKQEQLGLTYLFITHDLAVVEHFATRVVVMYLGTICEIADRETLFRTPKHPYTQALLSSIPRLDNMDLQPLLLKGEVPTPTARPQGCSFCGRCPVVNQRCYDQIPVLQLQNDGSSVACHAVEEGRHSWK
jgi:peptide/nickel transport system ATP-binding protein